jgi:hypothetical protein
VPDTVTIVAVAGPGTPYISRETLYNASTGIAWGTIPRKGATDAEREAEQINICWRATSRADAIARQVLRATINTEEHTGPGSTRVNIDRRNGNGIITTERWPILQILSIQISPASCFPPQWTTVPSGCYRPIGPVSTVYGTSAPSNDGSGPQQIAVAPGYIVPGRMQQLVQVQYINGWPHAGVTGATDSGLTAIAVDDCTGWAPADSGGQGACGNILAGSRQEAISCLSASAQSGPGTLTLATPLLYPHEPTEVVTTMPPTVQDAVILLSVAQALERGATATTHGQMPGTQVSSGLSDQEAAEKRATEKLCPFCRIF